MKLFVQIPCLNEQLTLPRVIHEIPRRIDGVDETKVLIVDDGSTDNTAEIATGAGADYVVRIPTRQGLARAFSIGLNRCLELGADIIVNTDGDHQYDGRDIPKLIRPILEGKADIVVGDRQPATLHHFSLIKRKLQALGSRTLSFLSRMEVPDATSGFRAISRAAALRTVVLSEYSYTLETLIQAGARRMAVEYVPVRTNVQTRPSRLMRSIPDYLANSSVTIVRAYTMYRPLRVFTALSALLILGGMAGVVRFLYFYITGGGIAGHIQSLILAAVLLIVGFQVFLIGLVADLIGFNRKILEEVLYRLRRLELGGNSERPMPNNISPPSNDR